MDTKDYPGGLAAEPGKNLNGRSSMTEDTQMNKAQKKPVSPSEFMRELRPRLYSDSTIRDQHQLKAEILLHHLETILVVG